MHRALSILVLCSTACGSLDVTDPLEEDDLTVAATLGPQSFAQGTLSSRTPELAYAFHAVEGDVIAPDAWPSGGAFVPTLVLLGPRGAHGHREVVATGRGRDGRAAHPAIDGFRVPRTGSYLLVVGHAGKAFGAFTVRLWMQSSHAPRQEAVQLDLALAPSEGFRGEWTEADLDARIAELQAQRGFAEVSDAVLLLQGVHSAGAVARAREAVAAMLGTPDDFWRRSPREQALALRGLEHWLLTSTPVTVPFAQADETIRSLVAGWPGARLRESAVRKLSLDGVPYGFIADWSAEQHDSGGRAVWAWFATEWFDTSGRWLGEQTAGASEPDD